MKDDKEPHLHKGDLVIAMLIPGRLPADCGEAEAFIHHASQEGMKVILTGPFIQGGELADGSGFAITISGVVVRLADLDWDTLSIVNTIPDLQRAVMQLSLSQPGVTIVID